MPLVLGRMFARTSQQGQLDFLNNRCLQIRISDCALDLRLTLRDGRLQQASWQVEPDIRIEGVLYAFVLLIAQLEDPDTLFFRRQLKVEGDTELGLYIKNFLAAYEPGEELEKVQGFLQRQIIALRGIQF